MDNRPQLDVRRHFAELVRDVLPIFLLVALVLFLVAVPFLRDRVVVEEGALAGSTERVPRISLLAAADADEQDRLDLDGEAPFDPAFLLVRPIDRVTAPLAARWDAPMGSAHAALTYNAQPFLVNRHLGDDLNGIGGQNTDLGDPVYAATDGVVAYAGWASAGWGNVVTLLHRLPDDGALVQSFYGHLDAIRVPVGAEVRRGQVIGTVGNADGRYPAHLHFELRRYDSLATGAGYADQAQGRFSGERFLRTGRGAAADWLSRPPEGVAPVTPDDDVSLEMQVGEDGGEAAGAPDGEPPAIERPGREAVECRP